MINNLYKIFNMKPRNHVISHDQGAKELSYIIPCYLDITDCTEQTK